MNTRTAEGVLLTGVYGSGKSSVAEEIAYLLEQRAEPYALLDLDYLGWAGTGDRVGEFGLMLQNLAAVSAKVLDLGDVRLCKPAAGPGLRDEDHPPGVVRAEVPGSYRPGGRRPRTWIRGFAVQRDAGAGPDRPDVRAVWRLA